VGDVPFHLKWAIEVTHPFNNRSRRQISACNVSAVRDSEKSSIITNRKLYMSFPTSYRYNAYVKSKSPKEWLEKRTFLFWIKLNFNWMKFATKFLWQKTCSSKAVAQLFPYLAVHRLQRETKPFNLKFSLEVTHPLKSLIRHISSKNNTIVSRFEVEQVSRGLSAIAELLVRLTLRFFDDVSTAS